MGLSAYWTEERSYRMLELILNSVAVPQDDALVSQDD